MTTNNTIEEYHGRNVATRSRERTRVQCVLSRVARPSVVYGTCA